MRLFADAFVFELVGGAVAVGQTTQIDFVRRDTMGRISENSLRYRKKEKMVSDVVFVLNTPDDQLSYAAKYSVLKQVTWAWTEYNGKYEGCEYWSVKA